MDLTRCEKKLCANVLSGVIIGLFESLSTVKGVMPQNDLDCSELLPKSRDFLRKFIKSKLNDYRLNANEYTPQQGYGEFPRFREYIDIIRDILYWLDETLGEVNIPENFSSPEYLIKTVKNAVSKLEAKEELFEFHDVMSKKKDTPWNAIARKSYEMRNDTIGTFKYFLKMAEQEQTGSNHSQSESLDKREVKEKNSFKASHLIIIIPLLISAVIALTAWLTYTFAKEQARPCVQIMKAKLEKPIGQTSTIKLGLRLKNTGVGVAHKIRSTFDYGLEFPKPLKTSNPMVFKFVGSLVSDQEKDLVVSSNRNRLNDWPLEILRSPLSTKEYGNPLLVYLYGNLTYSDKAKKVFAEEWCYVLHLNDSTEMMQKDSLLNCIEIEIQ